jgi:uncharacterized repeat protein (TIGR01451 family)
MKIQFNRSHLIQTHAHRRHRPRGKYVLPLLGRLVLVLSCVTLCVCAVPLSGHAAAPAAGTIIGNQASATYTDASGVEREVTSNVALTTVQQVGAVLLSSDQTILVGPGGQVVFKHSVANTGNGSDSFTLTATNLGGDNFDLTNVHIYPDANQDGAPDSFTDITSSGSLGAGEVFHFVVVGNAPGSATSGQQGNVSVVATSTFDGSKTSTNTDTAQISDQAVINVTKSALLLSGNPGITNTFTLTYVNTGNNTATNLTITDVIPTGMTYITNSGRWSVSGSTALTDAAGGDPAGISYSYSNGVRTVTATIAAVAPGNTAYITFQVIVDADNAPGIINNTATYGYDDGSGTIITDQQSNTVGFRVNQVASVTLNDDPLQTGDTTLDDVVTVTNANQGAVVVFNNRLHNTSAGTDTFNITFSGSTFPAGTTFQLYQSDGNTPLVDSDGDSVPDTGPVASNSVYTVVLKATLPPSASGNNGGAGFTVTVTAASSLDSGVSDTTTDKLNAIGASSVDLTNNSAGGAAPGAGAGPEALPVVTNSTNANSTTRFTLYVNNTSAISDSYDLAASTNAAFSSISLPSGWTVVFRDSGESVIGNTGVIASGGNKLVYADVTIPAGASPGDTEIYFRALSPTTTASDIIHDRVTVATVHSITIAPNNNGQVTSGGTVNYTHQLCNAGNVSETVTLTSTNSDAATGWSNLLFEDTNGNGSLDVGDAQVSGPIVVAPGACLTIFVKVTAPSGATVGSSNTTTVNGTAVSGAAASATDSTSVISSDLQMLKEQALDANCDGVIDSGSYGTAPISTNAVPGACILYRIRVTNNGIANVTSVHVFDTTPAYTTYNDAGGAVPAAVSGGSVNTFTGPSAGSAGAFDFNIGTIGPGATATITFGVKIDQ